jgi:hypothetical protein
MNRTHRSSSPNDGLVSFRTNERVSEAVCSLNSRAHAQGDLAIGMLVSWHHRQYSQSSSCILVSGMLPPLPQHVHDSDWFWATLSGSRDTRFCGDGLYSMNNRGTISPERIKWRNMLGCYDIAITTLRVDRDGLDRRRATCWIRQSC